MKANGVNGACNGTAARCYKRTILVTGATDGVGKQLARDLVNNKENFVIVHGRCERKCVETMEEFAADGTEPQRVNGSYLSLHETPTGSHKSSWPQNATYIAADFGHFKQVLNLIKDIKADYSGINVIICCASIMPSRRLQSRDGLELQFQVNHLAHFAILNGLVPFLERNVPSRILTVGSMLHVLNPIDWEDVNCARAYDKFQQFSRTMLMNHMMTFGLHRLFFKHHVEFRVTANVVDADQKTDRRGLRTSMTHTMAEISASETHLAAHSHGVQTLVRLAEWDAFAHTSGKYFNALGKEVPSVAAIRDVRLQNRMWQLSTEFCRRYGGEAQANGVV